MLNVFTAGTAKNIADDILEYEELPKVEITVNPVSGSSFTLTDINISGSVEIDRYTQSGDDLEIGSASAAECKFTIENYNGEFSDKIFEGAEIIVKFVFNNTFYSNTPRKVQTGRFTIDEKPRMSSQIKISALDDMVKFDKPVPDNFSLDGETVFSAISMICSACNVVISSSSMLALLNDIPSDLRSRTLVGSENQTDEIITYRQYLMWILQLICTNAYIDFNGLLSIGWYSDKYPSKTSDSDTALKTIDADKRFSTSFIEEKYIGVEKLVSGELEAVISSNSKRSDTDYYLEFDLSDNPFRSFYHSEAELQTIFDVRFSSFYYLPFSAQTVPLIWFEPLDIAFFKMQDGTVYNTFVSHTNISSSGNMKIEIKGESKTKSGYATLNPLTAQEKKILNDIRNNLNKNVSEYEHALIEFNKAVNAGVGVYTTTYNGVEYHHDADQLQSSTYVMKQTGEGIAWTDDGIELDGSGNDITTWKYGFSKNGTAIVNTVEAYKINAELINCTDLKAINATIAGWNMTENQLYSDYGRYRAFIQNAQAAGADSWIFSTQYKNDNNEYEQRFVVQADGTTYIPKLNFYQNQFIYCNGIRMIGLDTNGNMQFGYSSDFGYTSIHGAQGIHLWGHDGYIYAESVLWCNKIFTVNNKLTVDTNGDLSTLGKIRGTVNVLGVDVDLWRALQVALEKSGARASDL